MYCDENQRYMTVMLHSHAMNTVVVTHSNILHYVVIDYILTLVLEIARQM